MQRIHILAIGQSNLANHGEKCHESLHGRCFDTSFRTHPLEDPVPGGTGTSGSIWPLVANCLFDERPDADFNLTLRAQGGTAVEEWAPGGRCFEYLMKSWGNDVDAMSMVTQVVWHQGERDTLLETTSDDYLKHFRQMYRAIRNLSSARWVICRASYRMGVVSEAVVDAQNLLISELPGAIAGPETDLLGTEMRRDNTHLNEIGQAKFARELASILLRG